MANAHFPLITQNLSLDLVNTEIISYDKRHDLIQSEKDLMAWLEIMGETAPFLSSFTLQQVQEPLQQRIHQFRAELRKHFESIAEGSEPSLAFIAFLQDQIAAAPFSYQILDDKLARIPNGKLDDSILSLIAYDALWLIHTNDIQQLKRCANEKCILLFLDKTGRRKWCSMKICGNRQKVSRHQKKINNK
ncbi:CGNR zinc finger domain-containing protein [Bacillus mojavensis]|uniref:CGNR zinc finger domain-containing protein n=1 Tax=Bacillus mojavensis TaxID=72360 RepID=UPI002DB689A7|nr:CGNR zinc finger domain-containing protein [Bacillus mojavensis]MEC1290349.1 CGNR zinc finger domain-containing protein [Bacillus mojavensis]MEC1636258.1 CGNR zinc finger domain-containing protein [Bacillus mojavensis]MEC1703625.1 CGNR zinc finger domain-containing protein [Bacillus mojavensis]MEC5247273.1 CGNR zinc finger domain-containing protein [Bacillus mojavensis]